MTGWTRKGGPPASANFDFGAKLTELVLLGVVALRSGRKLEWDALKMRTPGAPNVGAFIKETYRTGWEIT